MARRWGKTRLIRGGIAVTVLACSLVGIGATANAKPICDGENPPPVCDGPVDPPEPTRPPTAPAPSLEAPTGLSVYNTSGYTAVKWWDPNGTEDGYVIEWVGHDRRWTTTAPGRGPVAVWIDQLPVDTGVCLDVWAYRGASTSPRQRYCSNESDYPVIW